MRPFAEGVADYALAGWPCILPVPVAAKHPPPVGYTGADGADTAAEQLVAWAGTHGDSSIAIRMPDGVIGLDVDHYRKGEVDKRGGDSLAEYEQRWGALPPTWRSSARDLPSGIRFYRVPAGRYATKLGESIEIIQRHHRYAVVWPSPHVEVGEPYRWYAPDGSVSATVPKPNELPELPEAWVAGLREGATEAGPAAAEVGRGQALLSALMADRREPCAEVTDAGRRARTELAAAESGSRHDITTARVHHLIQLGAWGHPGVAEELLVTRAAWEALTAGEGREGEFDRMLLTSARKAVTVVGDRPVDRDPCFAGGEMWAPPAPGGGGGISPGPLAEPMPWSVRLVIGTHEWNPLAEVDQGISAAVLHRMYPVLRYAVDAGSWLLRGPDRWESRGDLTRWAVHELADLHPRGNPDAPKDSEDARLSARRKRLMMTAGRNGVASTMAAAVAAGTHPCSLKIADLDTDPGLLWAGGLAWDLRGSADQPRLAQIDPGTPHMHSAAVMPADVPTPLWDAFLATVWPDAEVRQWALRVLAITLTGVPDAALPILLGPQRRGKTQVVHLLMSVLGSYALAADPRLLGGAESAHASIVYALLGRRLAFVDEGPREGRWAQERLKQLTGGGQLTGNEMRRDPVTFSPTHTLVLTANDEPPLTDPAVRARVRLIPCEGDEAAVRATRGAIGDTDSAAWRAEAPGVLWHMIREAGRWFADRNSALTAAAPEHIRTRADLIAADQDPVGQWVTEACEPYEPGTKSGQLHAQFVGWCRDNGVRDGARPTSTKWGRRLTELGYPPDHRRDGKYRLLRVTPGGGFYVPQPPAPPANAAQPRDGFGSAGDGSVTGSGADPSRPENPGQTPNSYSSVTGVTSSSLLLQQHLEINNDHGDAENLGETGVSLQPVTPTPPNVAPEQPKGGSDGSEGNSSQPPEAGGPADRPSRKRSTTTGRYSKAAQREAEKAAARQAAAGESYPLPAVVERSGRITPLTPAEALACLAAEDGIIGRSGALTVDVEHTGYPVGHPDYALRTVQLGDKLAAVDFDPTDPAQAEVIRAALAAAPKLHAHSATADLVPLVHAGLLDESAWERMHDTVIPAKLADPASTGSDPGLKQLATAVLGEAATSPSADQARAQLFKLSGWLTDTKATTPVARSGWAQVDPTCATMIRYAASDVLDAAAVAERLPELPAQVVERERAVQRITARVAHRGLRIDREHVAALDAEHRPAEAAAAARIREYGVENPGSDRQLAERLTELGVHLPRTKPSAKFPEGQPSVAAGVLEALKDDVGPAGELISAVLDYRHHETVLTTFLEPYRVLCERGDGRARPTVYTLGTDTGRMSCVRPNLQQLPRQGGVRACITADPGQVLVSADFSGVEIRVMAALSQDPDLLRMLAEGAAAQALVDAGQMSKREWQSRYDLHARVAAQAYGPDWTKADRYDAKRGVFGWAYGGGIPTLARQIGVPEHVMAAIVDSLQLVAPGYVAWADELKRRVRHGHTAMPTYAGRVIHLPSEYPHKAPNYAIQGTARELLVDALLAWDQTRWGGGVVLPVHDEIVTTAPEDEAEAATEELVRCMTRELYGVQIAAEASQPAFAWRDSA